MIERKTAYSEDFNMSKFPKTSEPRCIGQLAQYLYVYQKVTSDESFETSLINGDIKGLLTSEDELSAMYSFEFSDPSWTEGIQMESLISKSKLESGLGKFLMEKSSIIVLGTD